MPNQLKIAAARQQATVKTAKLLWSSCGGFVFIVAVILTAILSLSMQLNALVVFAGSLFGLIIVCLKLIPVKVLWRSEYFLACQENELWDVAEELLFQDAGDSLQKIFDGKDPGADLKVDVVVAQAVVFYTRRGELRKSQVLCEWQYRKRLGGDDDAAYDATTLAAIYIERGHFKKGLDLALKYLDTLVSSNRKHSPACSTTLMALIQGNLMLHKYGETHSYLEMFRESIDRMETQENPGTMADHYIQSNLQHKKIEDAFYWLFFGQSGKKSDDAEIALRRAMDIMSDEKLQKTVTLLLPEIMVAMAELQIRQHQHAEALEMLERALQFYDRRTIYRGVEYVAANGKAEFCKLKLARGNNRQALESTLEFLEKELEPLHPKIATASIELAYSHIADGNLEGAMNCLTKALNIRMTLFGSADPDVAEAQRLLLSLEGGDGNGDGHKTITGLNAFQKRDDEGEDRSLRKDEEADPAQV